MMQTIAAATMTTTMMTLANNHDACNGDRYDDDDLVMTAMTMMIWVMATSMGTMRHGDGDCNYFD